MPHIFQSKSSKSSAQDVAPKGGKSRDKSALRGLGFDAGEAALKPKDDKKGGVLSSMKSALGFGSKDKSKERGPQTLATASQVAAFDAAAGAFGEMYGPVANIESRCKSMRDDGGNDVPPDLLARLNTMIGLTSRYQPATDHMLKVYTQFGVDRVVEPLQAAMRVVERLAVQIKLELYGHAGAGDSCTTGSLMFNIMSPEGMVDGKQLGAEDKKKGIKADAPAPQGVPDDMAALPLGGAGWTLYSRAVRNYADAFVAKYDEFVPFRGTL